MNKVLTRALIGLGVVLLAAAAGLYLSACLAPQRLRTAIEELLARSSGAPVTMGSLRVMAGFPIELGATDLRLWGGALTIEAATGRIDLLSLLTGHPRLSRLALSGAHLRIQRGVAPDGVRWSPEPFAELAELAGRTPAEPLLAPLYGIEATVRFLLAQPLLAARLELEDSRVSYVHDFSDRGGAIEPLWLSDLRGTLRHSRLRREAELFLAAQLVGSDGPRGSIECEGRRDHDGAMRISMAATELEISTLVPYLGESGAEGRLRGRLSGVADFETAEPGYGELHLDLVTRDFESAVSVEGALRTVRADDFSVQLTAGVDADYLEIAGARVVGPALAFELDAVVERPIGPGANAGLGIAIRDIDLEQARALIRWLPGSARARATALADSIRAGRIAAVELRGGAPLALWRDLALGRELALPRALRVMAEVEGMAIALGGEDRLEDVSGSVSWTEDRLELKRASGSLNGAPMPELDISFIGVGQLFAGPASQRVVASGASSLTGLTPPWNYLASGDGDGFAEAPSIWIDFDHLLHPGLVWPLRELQTRFEPTEDGAHVVVSRAVWAGIPLRGAAEFVFRPDRRIRIRLEAGPEGVGPAPAAPDPAQEVAAEPAPAAAEPPDRDAPWPVGHIEIGAGAFGQRSTRSDFRAVGGRVQFDGVQSELDPAGELRGSAALDLGQLDQVPYELRFTIEGGDVSALLARAGLEPESVTGSMDLHGTLAGSIRPGESAFARASGMLRLEARDGTIRRTVPPILAIAMASEALPSFSGRDRLRYRRCTTTLEFESGYVSTESFDLDGPDVRLFASGGLDLARPPHELDAEVALFLFRQLDRALEKIPLLNVLLLGENDNLIAAYYELAGPWEEPTAVGKPLRTIGQGPGGALLEGIPKVVKRGMEALGNWISAPRPPQPDPEQLTAPFAGPSES